MALNLPLSGQSVLVVVLLEVHQVSVVDRVVFLAVHQVDLVEVPVVEPFRAKKIG
jgi:hypothetical protein